MLTGRTRVTSDAFFTKSDVAARCIETVRHIVDLVEFDLIIEPSAGSGAFSSLLPDALAFDIEPQAEGIVKQDFLELNTDALCHDKRVLVIGNPPFGRQSSLAKRFIKKCASFADTIAFILPKSFKKESQAKAFPLDFHKVHEKDLDDDSFTIQGRAYPVPCVFQIWRRIEGQSRAVEEKQTPSCYAFVKKDQDPDYALRRVGVNAGAMSSVIDDKSPQSHYFIKLDESIDKTGFEAAYSTLVFTHNNTVGPRSISKQEFTKALNAISLAIGCA